MDPVFAVLLDVARLASHQPPAIRQTWGVPECISQPETPPLMAHPNLFQTAGL